MLLTKKLNIFEQKPTAQACFWVMLFNFMSPISAEIELTTPRRKILSEIYCRKGDPNSRTLQNTLPRFFETKAYLGFKCNANSR